MAVDYATLKKGGFMRQKQKNHLLEAFSYRKGYYKYFGASYRSYGLYPMRKVAI